MKFSNYIPLKGLLALLLFCGLGAPAMAIDIEVSITNGTKKAPQTSVEEVRILSLSQEQGMQVVQSKQKTGAKVLFQDLPVQLGPFLVQVTHQGVNYNERVPFGENTQTLKIPITIYERSSNRKNINTFKLVVFFFVQNALVVQESHYFENLGTTTFSEKGDASGVYFKLPPKAQIFQTLASLGNVADENNMLRINPQPVEGKENLYLLNMPVLPGAKLYQVQYFFKDYNKGPLKFDLNNYYPLSENTYLIVNNELNVALASAPKKQLTPVQNEITALGISLKSIAFPARQKRVSLSVSGGVPEAVPEKQESQRERPSGEVITTSPANIYLKIGSGLALLVIALLITFYLNSNPAWLQMRRMQTKGRLEYELDQLQKIKLAPEKKEKKVNQIKARLKRLEQLLEE